MKLRSSSFSLQPNEEVIAKNSEMSCKSICKETSHSHPQHKLKKYNSYPCDYVSDFSLLTLSDTESMKSENLSQISDDCKSTFNNSIISSDCDEKQTIDTASVCTDSAYGFEADDVHSDSTYRSSIHRSVKRRKLTNLSDVSSENMSCFSGFDSDIYNIQGLKQDTESENDVRSDFKSDFKNSTKSFDYVKWFCTFTLFLVLIGIIFLSSMSFCNHHHYKNISLENVQTNLTRCLIGHEYSIPIFLDILERFVSDYYNKDIYLTWVVGGIGVGKSYTKYIIKNSLPSCIIQQSVLIPLIPNQNVSVENIVENLVKNMDACKPNIVFVDGYDENDITLEFVEILINKLHNRKRNLLIPMRVLIIVIGTYKSSVINSFYLNHLKEFNSNRESFNINEIQTKMYSVSPFSSILDKYPHHFAVVPFLPLEVSHLEKCVISQLNFISKKYLCNTKFDKDLENFLLGKNFTMEKIQKEVLSLSDIQPSKTGNLVPSGCKRVYQIVSSFLYFPLNIHR